MPIIKNVTVRFTQQALQFVITVLIAGALGPKDNGFFSLFITEMALAILIFGLSAESMLTYFLVKKEITPGLALKRFPLWILVQAAVFIMLFAAVRGFNIKSLFVFSDASLGFYALLFLIGSLAWNYSNALFTAARRFETVLFSNIISMVLFLLMWLMVSLLKPEWLHSGSAIACYSLLIFFQGLAAWLLCTREYTAEKQENQISGEQKKTMRRYLLLVFTGNLLQFLCYRMDFWFVDYYYGKQELGLYAFASKWAQLWWIMPQLLAAILFPLTAFESFNRVKLNRLMGYVAALGVVTALLALVLYPIVINFFPNFEPSYYAFAWLLPGVIFFSVNLLLAAYFAGIGRVDINFKASFLCFAIVLVLDILLIPEWGSRGAAIASSAAYICSTVMALAYYLYGKKN